MFKNMTLKQALTSKGILGGLGLIAVGVFLMTKDQYALGAGQISLGLGMIGIRDSKQA